MAVRRRYWLMKSEPGVYSFDDLVRDGSTYWEGVRNYRARNLMRDEMKKGDGVLFYHSNADPPGVAGIAEIAREAYPDPTQFDRKSKYQDEKSTKENPRWVVVDLEPVRPLERFVPLEALKAERRLQAMGVVQRGNRLSVQAVSAAEWKVVLELGGTRSG